VLRRANRVIWKKQGLGGSFSRMRRIAHLKDITPIYGLCSAEGLHCAAQMIKIYGASDSRRRSGPQAQPPLPARTLFDFRATSSGIRLAGRACVLRALWLAADRRTFALPCVQLRVLNRPADGSGCSPRWEGDGRLAASPSSRTDPGILALFLESRRSPHALARRHLHDLLDRKPTPESSVTPDPSCRPGTSHIGAAPWRFLPPLDPRQVSRCTVLLSTCKQVSRCTACGSPRLGVVRRPTRCEARDLWPAKAGRCPLAIFLGWDHCVGLGRATRSPLCSHPIFSAVQRRRFACDDYGYGTQSYRLAGDSPAARMRPGSGQGGIRVRQHDFVSESPGAEVRGDWGRVYIREKNHRRGHR